MIFGTDFKQKNPHAVRCAPRCADAHSLAIRCRGQIIHADQVRAWDIWSPRPGSSRSWCSPCSNGYNDFDITIDPPFFDHGRQRRHHRAFDCGLRHATPRCSAAHAESFSHRRCFLGDVLVGVQSAGAQVSQGYVFICLLFSLFIYFVPCSLHHFGSIPPRPLPTPLLPPCYLRCGARHCALIGRA